MHSDTDAQVRTLALCSLSLSLSLSHSHLSCTLGSWQALGSWLLVAIAMLSQMHDAWVCIAWRLEGICSFVLQLQLNFIKESTTSYLYMYGTHRLKLHFG